MPVDVLAADASVRTTDIDGRLHLSCSHISKACVNPYYGAEIPKSEQLGLSPTKLYYLLRAPEELAKGASTFERLPILSKHVPVSADDHQPDLVVGSIGSVVQFNDPYLDADLCFWDSQAIAGIETDTVRELSCAYRYVAVMTPGTYQGVPYDGIMTEIVGNHLALVETGRAGSDVLAADEAITMRMTKLGKALFLNLGGMSPKLAQDSAMPALVGQASKKSINSVEMATALVAMDAALDPKKLQLAIDSVVALDSNPLYSADADKDDDDDDEDPAQDNDPADKEDELEKPTKDKKAKDKKMGRDKKMGKDEDKDEEEKDKKDKKAMDSFKKELREADEARRAVREVVGEVVAQDSASEIYAFALDEMKVDHKDVVGVPSLRALFNLAMSSRATAVTPRIAQDAAGLATRFPHAARFRQA